jgi:hypothetical protein
MQPIGRQRKHVARADFKVIIMIIVSSGGISGMRSCHATGVIGAVTTRLAS